VIQQLLEDHLHIQKTLNLLASQVMTRQDWESIKSMIPAIEDPVFGNPSGNNYRLLYQAIDSMAGNRTNRN